MTSPAELDQQMGDYIGRHCFNDPLRFVGYAFPWGQPGELAPGPGDPKPGPDEWQRDILDTLGVALRSGVVLGQAVAGAIRIAVASGHGVGKSALVAWIVLWAMSTRPHLSGVVTANTGSQLRDKTWRELSIWHKRAVNRHWFQWTATRFYQVDHPEDWFVSAVPWSKESPEAFAGQHAEHVLIVYDEASGIDDIIWENSDGATTTPGAIWIAFGNPTRNTGRFRECFTRFRHRWIKRQIDSRSAKVSNKAQLRQWIEDYGEDSDFVRVRVRGLFPRASSNQFISLDLINEAQQRLVEHDGGAPLIMGVDLARFGDDQSVIRWRRGRDARTLAPEKWRKMDAVYSANRIALAINDSNPDAVFVDGGGIGGPIIDILRDRSFSVFEISFGGEPGDDRTYANKRAEMYGDCRTWLKTGAIDDDKQLEDDLASVPYGFKKGSDAILLASKDDMRADGLASPDDGDALVLTFAMPVARKDTTGMQRATRNAVAEHDWPVAD